jgi:phosphoribosylaminoimidazole-succinocarboxamide synthase
MNHKVISITEEDKMQNLTKGKLVFEGVRKKLYYSNEPGVFILQFKDEEKSLIQLSEQAQVEGNGTVNNAISAFIMGKMHGLNIPNHFIHQINMREQAVYGIDMFPFTITVRNYATGRTMKHLGVVDQAKLPYPLIEYHMKTMDQSGVAREELITPLHLTSLGWLHEFEVQEIDRIALRVNDFLTGLFAGSRLILANYTLKLGRYIFQEDDDFKIMIGDEITPRTCALWNSHEEPGHKHRYLSEIEIAKRLGLLPRHEEAVHKRPHPLKQVSKSKRA